jgi:hypothetical protein
MTTDQSVVEYRLERWGRAYPIRTGVNDDDRAEIDLGRAFGNCLLADWVKYQGPPPRGRDCSGEDLAENPIEQQTERAVMIIAKTRPECAWALRARYCGRGRVGVERLELFGELSGTKYTRRQFYECIQSGCLLIAGILFKPAREVGQLSVNY